MIKSIFSRYERKYLLSTNQKNEIISYLKNYLVEDPYSLSNEHYTIFSIYFDTSDFSIIRNSIQKPVYKDKLRLRSYKAPLDDLDLVFLEVKKKFEGRVNKRRVVMTYKDAKNYIDHYIIPKFDNYMDNQIMNEIDYLRKTNQLEPKTFIRYDRIALMDLNDELRVTFDNNVQFRDHDISLDIPIGYPVLNDQNTWLMEIKSEDNFPLWLVTKLSEFKLYSQSFSKYANAYKKHLTGDIEDDPVLY